MYIELIIPICKIDCSIRISQWFSKFLHKKFLYDFCIQIYFATNIKQL